MLAYYQDKVSLSARRAWREIKYVVKDSDFSGVALRKESVDRNDVETATGLFTSVALRKESVDRNSVPFKPASHLSVALRKESVDRNTMRRDFKTLGLLSLSARRAWIEIQSLRSAY